MPKTSPASFLRPMRNSVVWAAAILFSAAQFADGGCQSEQDAPGGSVGGGLGSSASTGTGDSKATSGTSTGSGSGVTSGSGATTTSSGSGDVTSGTTSGAGGNSGASGSGGSGGAKVCDDVEPPPDPNWPGANCKKWATETKECTAA